MRYRRTDHVAHRGGDHAVADRRHRPVFAPADDRSAQQAHEEAADEGVPVRVLVVAERSERDGDREPEDGEERDAGDVEAQRHLARDGVGVARALPDLAREIHV